jgi:hypothetical protein
MFPKLTKVQDRGFGLLSSVEMKGKSSLYSASFTQEEPRARPLFEIYL